MVKLKYAGLCAAGFLTNFVFIAAFIGVCSVIIIFCETIVVLYILAGILCCVAAGALHALFRKAISQNLQKKTTIYSLITIIFPITIGVISFILAVCGCFKSLENLLWVLIPVSIAVESLVSGGFGMVFHRS